jgi:hypothetical protein
MNSPTQPFRWQILQTGFRENPLVREENMSNRLLCFILLLALLAACGPAPVTAPPATPTPGILSETATATATSTEAATATATVTENPAIQHVDNYYGLVSADITPILLPDVKDITQDVLDHPENYQLDSNIAKATIYDASSPIVLPKNAGKQEMAIIFPVRLTNYQINHVELQDGSKTSFNEAIFTFVFQTDDKEIAIVNITRRLNFYEGTKKILITQGDLTTNLEIGRIYELHFSHVNYPGEIDLNKLLNGSKDILFGDFSGEPFTIDQIIKTFQHPVNGKINLPSNKILFEGLSPWGE